MAFATWTFAFSAHVDGSEASFGLIFRLGLIPLFLFSGVVLPDQQPRPGAGVGRPAHARCGTASTSTRMLCLDNVDWSDGRWSTSSVLVAVLVSGWWRRDPHPRRGGWRHGDVDPAIGRRRRPCARARAPGCCVLRNYVTYKRQWKLFATGFLEPVFYLFSIGIGVGKLIHAFEFNGHTIPYAEFVAPGMLAASAFNGALLDSTFNVFFKLKYEKLYDQMLATPLTTTDIARGEIIWGLLRGASYSAAFLLRDVGDRAWCTRGGRCWRSRRRC